MLVFPTDFWTKLKLPAKGKNQREKDESYFTTFPVTTTKFHWGRRGSVMDAGAADTGL